MIVFLRSFAFDILVKIKSVSLSNTVGFVISLKVFSFGLDKQKSVSTVGFKCYKPGDILEHILKVKYSKLR